MSKGKDQEKICVSCESSYPAAYSSCPRCQLPLVFPVIGKVWRVDKLIGRGGMGAVFLAHHTEDPHKVSAVKVLQLVVGEQRADRQEKVGRFQREAEALGRLKHPAIVELYDFARERDGTLYMAMEYLQGMPLSRVLEAIEEHRFDCLIGGARRDEEKARAKERIFSHRDSFGQWQPKEQRPELWTLFNTRHRPGEHFRSFPISNWTELDVWLYIARENIPLPGLYYSHQREVIRRKGLLVPLTDVTPPEAGETVETATVRFRTVGDMTCTCPVESGAETAADIVAETLTVTVSERGATRMDDRTSDASMERRKKEGYF